MGIATRGSPISLKRGSPRYSNNINISRWLIPGLSRYEGRVRGAEERFVVQVKDLAKRLGLGSLKPSVRTGELAKHGKRLRSQKQPFQLLARLLDRPVPVRYGTPIECISRRATQDCRSSLVARPAVAGVLRGLHFPCSPGSFAPSLLSPFGSSSRSRHKTDDYPRRMLGSKETPRRRSG
jgi:hypothetical protein